MVHDAGGRDRNGSFFAAVAFDNDDGDDDGITGG